MVSYFYSKNKDNEQLEALFNNTAGVILLGTEFHESSHLLDFYFAKQSHTIPLVLLDNETFHFDVDTVTTDNVRGAYRAIEYLIKKGHTNIGYFSSRRRIINFDERLQGVNKAKSDFKNCSIQTITVDSATEIAYADICAWLNKNETLPTAFFADSDIIAFGAIRAFNQFGYRIPEDISLIGFDDMPACEVVTPPLTTIKVMKEPMGVKAVDILHQRILANLESEKKMNWVCRTSLSTTVEERSSVKAIASERRT